jgi:hypothetical protein
MLPSALKNQVLVASAMAERDSSTATAEAFKLLAIACVEEAHDIWERSREKLAHNARHSSIDRLRIVEITH